MGGPGLGEPLERDGAVGRLVGAVRERQRAVARDEVALDLASAGARQLAAAD